MPCTLCPVSCAVRPVPCVLYRAPYAVYPMPCAVRPMSGLVSGLVPGLVPGLGLGLSQHISSPRGHKISLVSLRVERGLGLGSGNRLGSGNGLELGDKLGRLPRGCMICKDIHEESHSLCASGVLVIFPVGVLTAPSNHSVWVGCWGRSAGCE